MSNKSPTRAEIEAAKEDIRLGRVPRGRPSNALIAARQELAAVKKPKESPASRMARITKRFNVLFQLAHGVCMQAVRSLIVSGAPGVGKSHTIMRVLESYKDRDAIKFGHVTGSLSAINLYKLMYEFRHRNCVLLIDDSDDIFQDEAAFSILKAGLDTSARRVISWMTETHILERDGVEKQFEYEGQMIFITNYDFQSFIDSGKRLAPHFNALMSRSVYLDLKLHDREDVCAWMRHMVTVNQILQAEGLSSAQEKEVLDWLETHMHDVRELSIRTAMKAAGFVKMAEAAGEDWKDTASILLFR